MSLRMRWKKKNKSFLKRLEENLLYFVVTLLREELQKYLDKHNPEIDWIVGRGVSILLPFKKGKVAITGYVYKMQDNVIYLAGRKPLGGVLMIRIPTDAILSVLIYKPALRNFERPYRLPLMTVDLGGALPTSYVPSKEEVDKWAWLCKRHDRCNIVIEGLRGEELYTCRIDTIGKRGISVSVFDKKVEYAYFRKEIIRDIAGFIDRRLYPLKNIDFL